MHAKHRFNMSKSLFGKIVSVTHNAENNLGYSKYSSVAVDFIPGSVATVNVDNDFNIIYNELKKYLITPLMTQDMTSLNNTFKQPISTIFDTSEYINQLSIQEFSKINPNTRISDYFIGEITKYIQKFGEDDAKYYMLNDLFALSQKGYFCYTENQTLLQTIENLRNQITELEENGATRRGMAVTLEASLTVNASFDIAYIIYFQRHGAPVGGVFDPTLLGEIRQELGL